MLLFFNDNDMQIKLVVSSGSIGKSHCYLAKTHTEQDTGTKVGDNDVLFYLCSYLFILRHGGLLPP